MRTIRRRTRPLPPCLNRLKRNQPLRRRRIIDVKVGWEYENLIKHSSMLLIEYKYIYIDTFCSFRISFCFKILNLLFDLK
jgi:hypothetical protein